MHFACDVRNEFFLIPCRLDSVDGRLVAKRAYFDKSPPMLTDPNMLNYDVYADPYNAPDMSVTDAETAGKLVAQPLCHSLV